MPVAAVDTFSLLLIKPNYFPVSKQYSQCFQHQFIDNTYDNFILCDCSDRLEKKNIILGPFFQNSNFNQPT